MNLNTIGAALNRGLAKMLGGMSPQLAAGRWAAAHELEPASDYYAQRAVQALFKIKAYDRAQAVSAGRAANGDPLEYWRHFASFAGELGQTGPRERGGAGSPRIALFNDTDRRTNIGCRLTSQSFKVALADAFPQSSLAAIPLRFKSLDMKAISSGNLSLPAALEKLVTDAYGRAAVGEIRRANLVVLQPEGTLNERTGLPGIAAFFSPLLLGAALGKPVAVLNGTIPAFPEARGSFVKGLLALLDTTAARDQISAEAYGIPFLPDAALLYEPLASAAERNGCLITTGARYDRQGDERIAAKALDLCSELGLRPVVLTRLSDNFAKFKQRIASMNGIFAETAGLDMAAETVGRCQLHVGGRYHMAILGLLCGVPSLLFNVRTRKNEWLAGFSPMVTLVGPDTDLGEPARRQLPQAGRRLSVRDSLLPRYVEALRGIQLNPRAPREDDVKRLLEGVPKDAA